MSPELMKVCTGRLPRVPVLEDKCEKGSGLQSIGVGNRHIMPTCTEEASQK